MLEISEGIPNLLTFKSLITYSSLPSYKALAKLVLIRPGQMALTLILSLINYLDVILVNTVNILFVIE